MPQYNNSRIIKFDSSTCRWDHNYNGKCLILNPKDYLHGTSLLVPEGVYMKNGEINYNIWFDWSSIYTFFENCDENISMHVGRNFINYLEAYIADECRYESIDFLIMHRHLANIFIYEDYKEECEKLKIRNENGIVYINDVAFVPPCNKYAEETPLSLSEAGTFTVSSETCVEGIKDLFGGLYSKDGKKFIKWLGSSRVPSYRIKDGVEEICDNAFNIDTGIGAGHMGLSIRNVHIPEGVKRIGDNAFAGSMLLDVNFPESLEFIGDYAFTACAHSHGLNAIRIPCNVKHIGRFCFQHHFNISEIVVSPTNKWFCSEDNAIYNKAKTELIKVAPILRHTTTESTYDPEDYIPQYQKGYTCRRIFSIPNSIEIIREDAFDLCYIKDIYLNDNIKDVRHLGSFESLHIGANVEAISSELFSNCIVKQITVSTNNKHFCLIDGVLYNKDKTLLIKCPKGIKDINIPPSAGRIQNFAFAYTDFEKICIPSNITIVGDYAFSGSLISDIVLPAEICYIGDSLFCGCNNLKRIHIPAGTEEKYRKCRYNLCNGVNSNSAFEGFYTYTRSQVKENSYPRIKDLHYSDDGIVYIPAGTWSYYNSKKSLRYYELIEVSKDTLVDYLYNLKHLLHNILSQNYGIRYYLIKPILGRSYLDTKTTACIRYDDTKWFCIRKIENLYSNPSILFGDILLAIGFDVDEFLRKRKNINEYTVGSNNFATCIGKNLAKPVIKSWDEQYVDEDTGDIITIKRSEILLSYGSTITDENFKILLQEYNGHNIFVFDLNSECKYDYSILSISNYDSIYDALLSIYKKIVNETVNIDLTTDELKYKVLEALLPSILNASNPKEKLELVIHDILEVASDISTYCSDFINAQLKFLNKADDKDIDNIDGNSIIECMSSFFDKKISIFTKMTNAEAYPYFLQDWELRSELITFIRESNLRQDLKLQFINIINTII